MTSRVCKTSATRSPPHAAPEAATNSPPAAPYPPLVLNEEEADAVVIALKDAATGSHPTEATAAVSALAKFAQVLPAKIRRRIDSLQRVATLPGPTAAPPPWTRMC